MTDIQEVTVDDLKHLNSFNFEEINLRKPHAKE